MARGIRFIAPIEAMSGNLSGLQELLYPTNNNSAYDSPEGQVNYARNYKPRYVGTYRRKDGSVSFQVKTRSAVNMTPETKLAMSVLGGVGACVGVILRTQAYKAVCEAQMQVEIELGADYKSLREFLDAKFRPALLAHQQTIVISPVGGIFNNPWAEGGTGIDLSIHNRVLSKFFKQLAVNGINFNVNSLEGVAFTGDTFDDLIENHPTFNILELKVEAKGGVDYVYIGDTTKNYLMLNGDYVESTQGINDGDKFTTTTVAPA